MLLLDEPLGALDLKLRKQMQLELMRIQREVGVTFVYVTHDQEEALVMSDRLAVMSQGRVEQIGCPEDIYERPATRFVAGFIGTSNIIEAAVTGRVGDLLQVESAPGDRLLVVPPAGRSISVGRELAFTVRPEKLRVVAENEPVADRLCTVLGTVVDVGVPRRVDAARRAHRRGHDARRVPPEQRTGERRGRARAPASGSSGIPNSTWCSATSPPSRRS